jgi:hypothetical protein
MTFADSSALIDAGVWRRGAPLFQRISQFRGRSQGAAPRHAATVRTLLCFAASLDSRQLISAADSDQMLSLMRPLRWATGQCGAKIVAIGLDGRAMLDEHRKPKYVDGMDSFIVEAFDEFVDDSSLGLYVADSNRPFADAAGKIGIVVQQQSLPNGKISERTKLADFAIVTINTTDGRVIHWGLAFLANQSSSEDDPFEIGSNQYGIALKEIIRRWMAP